MKSRWAILYSQQIRKKGVKRFYEEKIREKMPLLKTVIRYYPGTGTLLEVGCGTSVLSIYLATCLATKGLKVVAFDIETEMLHLGRKVGRELNASIVYVQGSMFSLPFSNGAVEIIYSHGVLEHFDDYKIVKVLKEQLRVAKTSIISVPSSYFLEKEKMYGDERFMSPDKWISLITQSGGEIVEWFAFDYHKGVSRMVSTLRRILLAGGIAPYLVFVVRPHSQTL